MKKSGTGLLFLLGLIIFLIVKIGVYIIVATISIGLVWLIASIFKLNTPKKNETSTNTHSFQTLNNKTEPITNTTVSKQTLSSYTSIKKYEERSEVKPNNVERSLKYENDRLSLFEVISNIEPEKNEQSTIEPNFDDNTDAVKNNAKANVVQSLVSILPSTIELVINNESPYAEQQNSNEVVVMPEWAHFYVYSADDLNRANKQQKEFYYYFKSEFLKGNCINIENNYNYAFILMFDLVEDYKTHNELQKIQEQLAIIGANYPKTARYTKNTLDRVISGELNNKSIFTVEINVSDVLSRSSNVQMHPKDKLVQKCKWVNKNEVIEVEGIKLKRGYFYIGEKFLLPENYRSSFYWGSSRSPYMLASVLNPELTVSIKKTPISTFSSYTDMTPHWRYMYLQWLAGDVSIEEVSLDILFLYLYGLELRMFIDPNTTDEERSAILKTFIEIKAPILDRVEDSDYEIRSFFYNFIDSAITKYFSSMPLEYLSEEELYECSTYKNYVLQQTLGNKRVISCDFAYNIAVNTLNFGKLIPCKYNNYIKSRFEFYFKNMHPKGIRIVRNYCSRREYSLQNRKITNNKAFYPEERYISCDIFESELNSWEIISAIRDLYWSINREFSLYNKFIEASGGEETLPALFALPDYINIYIEEKVNAFKNYLESIVENNDYVVIEVNDILKIWEYSRKDEKTLHKKYVDSILEAFDRLNYGIAPNYKIDKKRFDFNDKCIIFRKVIGETVAMNDTYTRMEIFVKMAAYIICADGRVTKERDYIRKYVSTQNDSNINQKQLIAYFEWLLLNKQRVDPKLKDVILVIFKESQRMESCNTLIGLCCVGGDVNPKRVEALNKILPIFGESDLNIHSRIHRILTGETDHFITIEKKSDASQFSIPKRDEIKSKFYIDTKKLNELEQQTKESQSILSGIFREENDVSVEAVEAVTKSAEPMMEILEILLSKDSWKGIDVEDLCKSKGQMLGSVLEKINDYSYSKVNDAVVDDDGEMVYIAIEYKEQLI